MTAEILPFFIIRLPQKKKLASEWETAIKKVQKFNSRSFLICKLHFNDDDFVNLHRKDRLQLRRRAVPSVFVDANKPAAIEYIACDLKPDSSVFHGECDDENEENSKSCDRCDALAAKLKHMEEKYKEKELEVQKLKDEIDVLKVCARAKTPPVASSPQSPLSPPSPPSILSPSPLPMDIGHEKVNNAKNLSHSSTIASDIENCIRAEVIEIDSDDDVKPLMKLVGSRTAKEVEKPLQCGGNTIAC